MSVPMGVELTELFQLIGEREVIKFKQSQQLETLYKQIDEMAAEITRLRKENEDLKNVRKLGEPTPDDPIRRFPVGVQGPGRGLGDDVPERPDSTTNRISQDGSSGSGESQTPGV